MSFVALTCLPLAPANTHSKYRNKHSSGGSTLHRLLTALEMVREDMPVDEVRYQYCDALQAADAESDEDAPDGGYRDAGMDGDSDTAVDPWRGGDHLVTVSVVSRAGGTAMDSDTVTARTATGTELSATLESSSQFSLEDGTVDYVQQSSMPRVGSAIGPNCDQLTYLRVADNQLVDASHGSPLMFLVHVGVYSPDGVASQGYGVTSLVLVAQKRARAHHLLFVAAAM